MDWIAEFSRLVESILIAWINPTFLDLITPKRLSPPFAIFRKFYFLPWNLFWEKWTFFLIVCSMAAKKRGDFIRLSRWDAYTYECICFRDGVTNDKYRNSFTIVYLLLLINNYQNSESPWNSPIKHWIVAFYVLLQNDTKFKFFTFLQKSVPSIPNQWNSRSNIESYGGMHFKN